jgi:hypothetical protein
LNYSAIRKIFVKIKSYKKISIPIISQLNIISKLPTIGNSISTIGDMKFTPIKGLPNLFISTSGAVFNSKHRYFIHIDNYIRDDGSVGVNLPIGKECRWLDIHKIMYQSWYGYIPRNTKIITKNNVLGDFTLSNITLTASFYQYSNIDKIRKSHSSLKIIKENEEKIIKNIQSNFNDEYSYKFPIPEIIDV